MSTQLEPLPEIGSEWRHATEAGVFVITKTTTDGWVIWTEKDAADAVKWVAPAREFASVFSRVSA